MKVNCKQTCWAVVKALVIAHVVLLSVPFIGGVYYSLTGDHSDEQVFLDECIAHLKDCRAACKDKDLCGVLDFAIRRYNKIGPWDVMFLPLADPNPFDKDGKVIGCNCPWCPGITLDPCLLRWSPEAAAMVLAHESMHDYFPYFGHAHVTPREQKLWILSYEVRHPRFSNGPVN